MSSTGCRSWTRSWVAALAAAALIVGVAMPAQAKDEFEYAFKVELGRIAAHEVVYAGKHILGTVLHGGHRHHQGCGHGYGYPGHYVNYGHRGYGQHYGHHYRRHGHHRGWRSRHGSHDGHRYGYQSPRGRTVQHLSNHRSGGWAHRGRGYRH